MTPEDVKNRICRYFFVTEGRGASFLRMFESVGNPIGRGNTTVLVEEILVLVANFLNNKEYVLTEITQFEVQPHIFVEESTYYPTLQAMWHGFLVHKGVIK
jgi:hypothetical protein